MTLTAGFQDSRVDSMITPADYCGRRGRAFAGGGNPSSAAWPQANRAYLIPFYVSSPVTIVEMFFISGTTPGTANFDLGIYRDDFTRIVSLGATACVNNTDVPIPVGGGNITDTSLAPGRYYMAMSAAATSITARAWNYGNSMMRALGLQQMDTAQPLPATITPASVGTGTFLPMICCALVDNVI